MEILPLALNEQVFKHLDAPSLGRLQCALVRSKAKEDPDMNELLKALMKKEMVKTVDATLNHAAHAIQALVHSWYKHRIHLETMMNVHIGMHVIRGSIRLPSGFFFQIRNAGTGNVVAEMPDADGSAPPDLMPSILRVLREELVPETLPYNATMATFKEAFCARWHRLLSHPFNPLVEYRFLDLPGGLSTRPLMLKTVPKALLADDCSPLQWQVPALLRSSMSFSLSTFPSQWHQVIQAQMTPAEDMGWALLSLCHAPVYA